MSSWQVDDDLSECGRRGLLMVSQRAKKLKLQVHQSRVIRTKPCPKHGVMSGGKSVTRTTESVNRTAETNHDSENKTADSETRPTDSENRTDDSSTSKADLETKRIIRKPVAVITQRLLRVGRVIPKPRTGDAETPEKCWCHVEQVALF